MVNSAMRSLMRRRWGPVAGRWKTRKIGWPKKPLFCPSSPWLRPIRPCARRRATQKASIRQERFVRAH